MSNENTALIITHIWVGISLLARNREIAILGLVMVAVWLILYAALLTKVLKE